MLKNVRVVIITSNSDYATQQVVNRLAASEYFKITKVVDTPAEAEQVIRAQKQIWQWCLLKILQVESLAISL